MTWQPPPRPAWVQDQIAVGARVGPTTLHPLEASELIATAQHAAGTEDFGGDEWNEGFARLCDALVREADLHAVGAALVRSELLRTLINRLQIVAAGPPVESPPITEPWFVCGTARSGTSILHELLALDPANRTPTTWEVSYSCPPQGGDRSIDRARAITADHEVRHWERICPEYLTMHENGGDLPTECIFVTAHTFMSEHWSGVHDVPTYNRWLQRTDLRPAYRWHRRHLAHLQHHTPPSGRWVLKAPSHLSALAPLFDVYPDAWVIQTHRDPVRTVPSTISLMATLRWMRSDRVDVHRLTTTMAKGVAQLFDWVRQQRSDGSLPNDRFVDVRDPDLVRDPVATVGAIYDSVGATLTHEHATAIVEYLAVKPQSKHGSHRYSLVDFGLDADDLRTRYGAYCTTYEIEAEA